MLIIHASSDLHPPNPTHQTVTPQPLIKQPTPSRKTTHPNLWIRPMPQGSPAEAL